MPHKNPKCPKCGGATKVHKSAGFDRCFYKCRYCGETFIDWKWKAIWRNREEKSRAQRRDRK